MFANKLYFNSTLTGLSKGITTRNLHVLNVINHYLQRPTFSLVSIQKLSLSSPKLSCSIGKPNQIQSRTYSKKPVAVSMSIPVQRTEPAELAQGRFKTYKPSTPSLRWLKRPVNDHLWKGKPIRKLTLAKKQQSGRNHHGHITVRHRGGGHKRRVRVIDFHRWDPEPHVVVRIEYDPNRSGHLALLQNTINGKYSYIIAPHDLQPGTIVRSFRKSQEGQVEEINEDSLITKVVAVEKGNCIPLKLIPVGTTICCIGLKPDGPAILCRSAGVSAQLVRTGEKGYAQVRLKSGEVRLIHVDCCATIGTISNPDHQHATLGKAGRSRWLGIRPTVRGVAMNSVDHPHGGGRGKSKGNRHPVSPWNVLAKGGKTRKRPNKWVVKPRERR